MILAASNLFIAYLIFGPCIWIGAFIGMAIGWSRVNRLRKKIPPLPERPPHVTILVPAKDEAGGIAGCIERIAEQAYPRFDIIAVDDRSTDRTGVILDELAMAMNGRATGNDANTANDADTGHDAKTGHDANAANDANTGHDANAPSDGGMGKDANTSNVAAMSSSHCVKSDAISRNPQAADSHVATTADIDRPDAAAKKLRVLHIEQGALPSGWLGKCHALSNAEKLATGEWLLFVDSDVTLQPTALAATLAVAIQRKYDAVSLITRLECRAFWERLMLPLLGGVWTMMYFVSLTNRDNSKVAVANGQFFLIRREAYEKVGGHEAVRNQITEDVELMRLLKGEEFTVRFLLGGHLASTRMHSSLKQMFHGWGRIFSGTSRRRPWRILVTMLFVMCCGLGAYAAIAIGISRAMEGDCKLLIAALLHLGLMTGYIATVYGMSGNQKRYAWLFPISGAMLLGIFIFALRMCYTGKVKWRDTHYGAELNSG